MAEGDSNRRMITVLLGVLSLPLILFGVTLIGGAISPREHRAEESRVLSATPEQVYAAVTDVSSFVEWRTGLEGVELLVGEGHQRWRERADGEQVTYEVAEQERPNRLVTRIADDADLPWGGTWTFTIAAEGDGSRVTIVEDGWVDNLVFRFFARFVFGYDSTIEQYLEDLASYASSVVVAEAQSTEGPRNIDVQGHRGARGHRPENTLEGFREALAIGVTTLEMDLAVTSDGVVVVHHDETLNADTTRGPDGEWLDASTTVSIRSLLREDLSTYDVGRLRPGSSYATRFPDQQAMDGARIPELVEVIALAEEVSGGTIRYNLELKRTPTAPERTADPDVFAEAALAVVDAAGVRDRTTFQSFDLSCIAALTSLAEDLTLACLTTEEAGEDPTPWLGGRRLADFDGSIVRLAAASGCSVWSPGIDSLDIVAVGTARELGLRVVPWTVNEPAAIAAAYDLGVDGIISDYPDRVRAMLEARGAPLPSAFSRAR